MTTPGLAIITGASSGLGQAFAYELAAKGYDLYLTGRKQDQLNHTKEQLVKRYNIRVDVFIADFIHTTDTDKLIHDISKLDSIDLLINNAGMGCKNNFYTDKYSNQENLLKVHVVASSKLIHTVVPIMKKQGHGAIVNVASLSAFFPTPISYLYSSSKAFIINLSECMHIDLKPFNIKVQVLCPGFIKTNFHTRLGMQVHTSWLKNKLLWMEKEEVAAISLKGIKHNKVICIPGFFNKLLFRFFSLMPKRLYYILSANQARKLHNETISDTKIPQETTRSPIENITLN